MNRKSTSTDYAETLQNLAEAPEGGEGEDDLEKSRLDMISQTVWTASDWTTETILRQIEKGNIQLNPSYQRREVWRVERKSKFIESLILGLPIPQIVLAEDQDRKNSYIVIDGKQRLLTLSQFAAHADSKTYQQLKLSELEKRTDLNGLSFDGMQADPHFADDIRRFENQTIRTVVIKSWPNEDVLYLIFLRLNTGSVQLSPQELRQALHPGPFLTFVDEKSGALEGFHRIFGSDKPDFRMRDAELMVRYYAYRNFLHDYKGNLKKFLDETSETLNLKWGERGGELEKQASDLEDALRTTFDIFKDNAFKKWDGEKYENRFNRAIFDVMVFYFSDKRIRKKAARRGTQVEKAFRRLCDNNSEFVKSIETTTKSMGATGTRLMLWGQVLKRRLITNIKVPRLVGKKIIF
jgi:Protein of unknown function DUF262